LPVGVPEEIGRKVAMGELKPEYVRDHYLQQEKPPLGIELKAHLEDLRKEKQDLERKNATLADHLKILVDEHGKLKESYETLEADHKKQQEQIVDLSERLHALKPFEEFYANLAVWVRNEVNDALKDMMQIAPTNLDSPAEVNITHEHTKINVTHTLKTLEVTDANLEGRLALLYAENALPDGWFRPKDVRQLMEARGWNWDPRTGPKLTDMCQWGFLKTRRHGHKAREYHVKITPDEAKAKGLLTVKEVTQ